MFQIWTLRGYVRILETDSVGRGLFVGPTRAVVPSLYVCRAVDIMVDGGMKQGQILAGTGIDPDGLTDPSARFTLDQQEKILERAVSEGAMPEIGLLLGGRLRVHDHGVYGFAAVTAPDVYQALVVAAHFFPLAGSPLDLVLEQTRSDVRLIVSDEEYAGHIRQIFVDDALAAVYRFLRDATNGKFRANALHLDFDKPSYYRRYAEIFDCPVLFGKRKCQLIMSKAQAGLQIASSDPETAEICKERCKAILKRMHTTVDFVDSVREAILQLPCSHRHADYVAAELGMSSRQLRRKLRDAKTSFQSVLDSVRLELSKDYLLQTRMSLAEIAPLLGYSEQANFRRAFKKWVGQTPSAYRTAHSRQRKLSQ